MKNILTLLHDDTGQESRLQAALDVARALNAHLTCLDVVQMPLVAADYFQPDAAIGLLQDERKRESNNLVRLRARLAREDVSWEIVQTTGDLASSITSKAGLADLIVINRELDDSLSPAMGDVATAVVLKTHKLVIAVPEDATGFMACGRAFVAWDGSPSAMTAVIASVPLLKLADSVLLYEVEDGHSPASLEEAAAYLSRHDIHARVQRVQPVKQAVDRLLRDGLLSHGSAYCVMGAYGHSRFREAMFGGVTRRMLASSPVPLLIAH